MNDIVTKAVGIVQDATTDESPNGAFEVILSAPTTDRDGEVIESRAFEPLPDHIPFDIDHGMSVVTTVGSGVPFYAEDGTLRVKGSYASTVLAQEVRTLVSEGHVRTTSVTFMAAKREEKDGIPHVVKAELLNGTFTPIPSNRQAVVLSSKGLAVAMDEKVGARNSAKDAEVIQSMHDGAVGLGAACMKSAHEPAPKAVVPDGLKSIIGSLEAQRDRVMDAVADAYPGRYPWLRGVMPDVVIFEVYEPMADECQAYRQTYTDDGSVVTLTGTPEPVDVMEVVVPDADADREPTDPADGLKTSDTEQSADKAASESAAVKAADSDTAESADEGSVMKALEAIQAVDIALALGGF